MELFLLGTRCPACGRLCEAKDGGSGGGSGAMDSVPDELLVHICKFLRPLYLSRLARCSKRLRTLILGTSWKGKHFVFHRYVRAANILQFRSAWHRINTITFCCWPGSVEVVHLMRTLHEKGFRIRFTTVNRCAGVDGRSRKKRILELRDLVILARVHLRTVPMMYIRECVAGGLFESSESSTSGDEFHHPHHEEYDDWFDRVSCYDIWTGERIPSRWPPDDEH